MEIKRPVLRKDGNDLLSVVRHRNFNKMDNKKIASEINYDIETGVYASFDKLKNRLEYIAHRLILATYIDNVELRDGEIQTLKENEYIDEFYGA